MVHFRTCEAAAAEAGRDLAALISKAQRPLLLLSGGSSLNVVKVAIGRLKTSDKKKLTIGQIDARYVPLTSDDSNWKQIEDAIGNMVDLDSKMAMMNMAEDADDIASDYSALLQDKMEEADLTIGLYGIASDGGIAGIKPRKNPHDFTKFLDGRHVVKFEAADFMRITTTNEVLTELDKVFVFACGKDKHKVVMDIDKDLPPHEHPAQLLKDAKDAVAYVNVGR